MVKTIKGSGKRKEAMAKATISKGTGKVKINNQLLDNYGHEIIVMKIKEPIILANNPKDIDINVRVSGGGWSAQADAVRLAIARCLVEYNKNLKKTFLEYDRNLLVADTRWKETCKPNDSKARAKRQKSYR
ncbi:MAG: 30S ribosomal protein S9 [Nanoarchaeota archaeon]|nr:30S ribosomal protein S9 [Nanoarchaeota archaeon]